MISALFMHRSIKFCILLLFLALVACSPKDAQNEAKKELLNFYSCSTVDWALMDTLYYRPYNCDWPEESGGQIHSSFPPEYAALYWNRLQNAKTYLHQHTLPLRSGASEAFLEQLSHTESAMDSVFVLIVSQEYYMRVFVDCYEEIMPQEIDKCFRFLN